ncbi:PfkB family carbohydrate kinase [Changpingibacter yushuensis]|uniref:PfkB family carbohydrate kinase n=1 Tax=Changpingibacter yushuensis TaxID=2758440 RepID=UPI00165D326B|nr:PfkB family carbohydrate kinase [Changpingibacter yushuensis]
MRTVFCGLTTVDLIQHVDQVPGPNQKIVSRSAILDVGGPAANAARTAGVLGAVPTLVSPIGTGVFAQLAKAWLAESEVTVVDLAADGDPAISSVTIDAEGNRAVVSSNNSGRSYTYPQADVLDGASALLIDGHLPDVQLALARTAKNLEIPVVLDGGSYKPGIEALLPHVTHAIISSDFTLPGVADDVLVETLAWKGIPFVARTHGGGSIEAIVDNKAFSLPVSEVAGDQIADTLGAGDVLHGAFTAALGAGQSAMASMSAASQLATLSVQASGALGWAEKLPSTTTGTDA